MANYLDKDGLLYFWQKIKNVFAQKTEIPTKTSDLTNDSNFAVDASYVHTDNNYTSTEKTKLSNIADGAEVNQNAFSNVKVGSTTIAADGETDTLELVAGSNVTLTPDATNDKVTIAATDTTYSNATQSAAGLMSSADKTKLDGIEAGAEVNAVTDVQVAASSVLSNGIANIPEQSYNSTNSTSVKGVIDGLLVEQLKGNPTIIAETSTVAGTAEKSLAYIGGPQLSFSGDGPDIGTILILKSTSTNTASSPTFKFGSGTAYAVKYNGSAATGGYAGHSSRICLYVFHSSAWHWIGWSYETNTTYSAATTSSNGLMSASDKTKLNGIAEGAEVNQNAFSNVKVGSTTVEADAKTDTLEFVAGSNVTLTPDATNDKITIAATDTTYSNATTSAAGLMSAADKSKLNGIEAGAEVNANGFGIVGVHNAGGTISYQEIFSGGPNATLNVIEGTNVTLAITNSGYLKFSATDTTYSDATQSVAGLMSTSDKTKLDGFSAASNYALKSDITGMYKYKGSVATASGLPSSGQTTGDVYNIEAASSYGGPGMNVAWNGSAWDPLGEIFSITSVTNAEIDTIVAS